MGYSSEAPEAIPVVLIGVCVAQSFDFCVLFCRPLCFIDHFAIVLYILLITPLLSSNFSFFLQLLCDNKVNFIMTGKTDEQMVNFSVISWPEQITY